MHASIEIDPAIGYWLDEDEPVPPLPEEDAKAKEAEEVLSSFFDSHTEDLFYERQLTVGFEDRFFHWITVRALRVLVAKGDLNSELWPMGNLRLRFYRHRKHRYWKRQAAEIAALVSEFSHPTITRGLGLHGEAMFDAALPRAGFMPAAYNVQSFRGREWTATEHDLDRVFERDGIAYGIEIKNTLPYIDRNELEIKLDMCDALDLRPLFIARMHPKSYMDMIIKRGGYGLIVKYQLYPYGHADLAKRVRERLGLPADSPRALAEGTIQRFLNWHLRHL